MIGPWLNRQGVNPITTEGTGSHCEAFESTFAGRVTMPMPIAMVMAPHSLWGHVMTSSDFLEQRMVGRVGFT